MLVIIGDNYVENKNNYNLAFATDLVKNGWSSSIQYIYIYIYIYLGHVRAVFYIYIQHTTHTDVVAMMLLYTLPTRADRARDLARCVVVA